MAFHTKQLQNIFNHRDLVLLLETWTNDFSDVNVNNFHSFVLNRSENIKTLVNVVQAE